MVMPYRNLLVRMYYTTLKGKGTPKPFCELRVYMITKGKLNVIVLEEMDFILEYLEWIMESVCYAILDKKAYYEIEGRERNVEIDFDEAKLDLARANVDKPVGEFLRYVRFEKKGGGRKEYVEYDIRNIHVTRESSARVERISFANIVPFTSFIEFIEWKYDNGFIAGSDLRKYKRMYGLFKRRRI